MAVELSADRRHRKQKEKQRKKNYFYHWLYNRMAVGIARNSILEKIVRARRRIKVWN